MVTNKHTDLNMKTIRAFEASVRRSRIFWITTKVATEAYLSFQPISFHQYHYNQVKRWDRQTILFMVETTIQDLDLENIFWMLDEYFILCTIVPVTVNDLDNIQFIRGSDVKKLIRNNGNSLCECSGQFSKHIFLRRHKFILRIQEWEIYCR